MSIKESQFSVRIRNYLSFILKTFAGLHSAKLLLYADGLAIMKKNGVTAMLRALNEWYPWPAKTLELEHEVISGGIRNYVKRIIETIKDRIRVFDKYFRAGAVSQSTCLTSCGSSACSTTTQGCTKLWVNLPTQ
ncbi:hypothetical protein [Candidatus Pyrohabitans sp.]